MNTVPRAVRDKCDYSEHLLECYMSGQILGILELFQTLPTAANMMHFIPKLITLLPLCLVFFLQADTHFDPQKPDWRL